MNTLKQVMAELKKKGSAQTVKTMEPHGLPDDAYGVKVADLKIIAKKIKGNQELALELYDTGHPDAQYLAGIVADGSAMTKKQLETWVKTASWHMVGEYSVPGVVSESEHALTLAKKWIKSKNEDIASAGWNTFTGYIATRPDDEIDFDEIKSYLQQILDTIDKAPNRVKYCMNGFLIAVAIYIKPLHKHAKSVAKKLGKVEVELATKGCKVPLATEYIEKNEKMGRIGKKRKSFKC